MSVKFRFEIPIDCGDNCKKYLRGIIFVTPRIVSMDGVVWRFRRPLSSASDTPLSPQATFHSLDQVSQ